MWKACALAKSGKVSAEAFVDAMWAHFNSRPPIGKLALKHSFLTMHQLFEVLGYQVENGLPFGESAIELGLITREQLAHILLLQNELATPVEDILMGRMKPSGSKDSSAMNGDIGNTACDFNHGIFPVDEIQVTL